MPNQSENEPEEKPDPLAPIDCTGADEAQGEHWLAPHARFHAAQRAKKFRREMAALRAQEKQQKKKD